MACDRKTTVDSLMPADRFRILSYQNGDWRDCPASVLLSYIQDNITLPGALSNQYAAPSATGFSVTVDAGPTWLILTPVAGYAAGTIVLAPEPEDGDEVLCNCTQSVTALTVSGNGNTVTGAPTTMAANAFFRLRFESVTGTWYRIG